MGLFYRLDILKHFCHKDTQNCKNGKWGSNFDKSESVLIMQFNFFAGKKSYHSYREQPVEQWRSKRKRTVSSIWVAKLKSFAKYIYYILIFSKLCHVR